MTWHDISTAPKDGTPFLAFGHWRPTWTAPEPRYAVMSRRDGDTYCDGINGEAEFWMPLPLPPSPPQ